MSEQTIRLLVGNVADLTPEATGLCDAVFCDPPYALHFMGSDWDKAIPSPALWTAVQTCARPGAFLLACGGTRTWHRLACALEEADWELRDTLMWLYGQGFPKSHNVGKALDRQAGATREVVGPSPNDRPAKVKGGAGFDRALSEQRGTYPKKTGSWSMAAEAANETAGERMAIDLTLPATPEAQRWEGYGSALKPAWEPVLLCQAPLRGTIARNCVEQGCGALNIDGCRIGYEAGGDSASNPMVRKERGCKTTANPSGSVSMFNGGGQAEIGDPKGRWPANVVLSHLPECREVGTRRVKSGVSITRNTEDGGDTGSMFGLKRKVVANFSYGDVDGIETVPDYECAAGCPVALLDEQSGEIKAGGGRSAQHGPAGQIFHHGGPCESYGDTGGASRFFKVCEPDKGEAWACAPGCPVAELDRQSGECPVSGSAHAGKAAVAANEGMFFAGGGAGNGQLHNDAGGASRFFYTAKADNAERHLGLRPGQRNPHPTVKPLDLCTYLAKLLLPPVRTDGQPRRILVPFAGSGSELIGALRAGWDEVVGVELSPEYAEIARQRIEGDQPLFYRVQVTTLPARGGK